MHNLLAVMRLLDGSEGDKENPPTETCVLFGPFSYIVQTFLAFLSFSVLICNKTNIIHS